MEFSPDADVDMALHDDSMLDMNLVAQFGMNPAASNSHGPSTDNASATFGNRFQSSMVPGVTSVDPSQQNFPSVEEYAALMGIKLEVDKTDRSLNGQSPAMNQFNPAPPPPPSASNMGKHHVNASYFEHIFRERPTHFEDLDGNESSNNITSMTLPAGVGSGMSSGNVFGPSPAVTPTNANLATGFTGLNAPQPPPLTPHGPPSSHHLPQHRMFDLTAEFMHSTSAGHLHTQKMPTTIPARPNLGHSQHDLGAQTLSPEVLSTMIKHSSDLSMRSFDNLNDEEKAALLKEEKSRERNRDHSRKSRLRKKEFVENLKQEVAQLQIYQQICEQCMDLMALVTCEASAVFLYVSSSYARLLGYQNHQLITGQSSFLDLVHPDWITDVRSIFQKFTTIGESRRFSFRIKAADGKFYHAETSARKAEKGIVCSTRVEWESDSPSTKTA